MDKQDDQSAPEADDSTVRPLTPDERLRPDTPEEPCVVLSALGHEWRIPFSGLVRGPIGSLRDQLYDRITIEAIDEETFMLAVDAMFHLMNARYELSYHEVAEICAKAEPGDFVGAVDKSLFGDREPSFGYTDWAEYSLWANGFNPNTLPRHLAGRVLQALEAAGKTLNRAQMLDADKWKRKRAGYLGTPGAPSRNGV